MSDGSKENVRVLYVSAFLLQLVHTTWSSCYRHGICRCLRAEMHLANNIHNISTVSGTELMSRVSIVSVGQKRPAGEHSACARCPGFLGSYLGDDGGAAAASGVSDTGAVVLLQVMLMAIVMVVMSPGMREGSGAAANSISCVLLRTISYVGSYW